MMIEEALSNLKEPPCVNENVYTKTSLNRRRDAVKALEKAIGA
jgi:hypothetical protein